MELPPGDPHHAPPLGLQAAIALAVCLERRSGFMSGPTVELNCQSPLPPEAVHLDPLSPYMKPSIQMWPRQVEPTKKWKEELLQIASHKARRSTEALKAETQICVAASAR